MLHQRKPHIDHFILPKLYLKGTTKVFIWVLFLFLATFYIWYSVGTIPSIVNNMKQVYHIPINNNYAEPQFWMYFVGILIAVIPAVAVFFILKDFDPFVTRVSTKQKLVEEL